MRRLMAHSVSVWESDPEAFSYHPVGYMQISPEVMHEDVASIYKQQKEIGYPSTFIEGEKDCMTYMQGLFSDWQAEGITSVLHEKKGGYANNTRSIYGLAKKAENEDVRIATGVKVTGFEKDASGAVKAVVTDKGKIGCDQVIIGAGPWVKQVWDMLELPKDISIKGRDGKVHDNVPMWTFWSLQEGTLGVDPKLQRTNDGKMPPVIHVDTDAPLTSDVDGKVITDKLWGIYYKPDFHFGGVQGGAMPFKVKTAPESVKIDPVRPGEPGLHRRRRFRPYVGVGAGLLPEALRRHHAEIQEGAVGRHRQLHRGFVPGVRPVLRERLCDRRQQPRLQDDRRRQAGGGRYLRQRERSAASVPLQPLRRRQAASDLALAVPVELTESGTNLATYGRGRCA